MIKVDILTLYGVGSGAQKPSNTVGNSVARTVGNRLINDVSDKACEFHPDFENIITVRAGDPMPEVKFTKVCCQEFQDSIVLPQ